MIRYVLEPPETLHEAIIHAGMMASVSSDHSYVIVCRHCDQPIEDHQSFGDCEIFQKNRQQLNA